MHAWYGVQTFHNSLSLRYVFRRFKWNGCDCTSRAEPLCGRKVVIICFVLPCNWKLIRFLWDNAILMDNLVGFFLLLFLVMQMHTFMNARISVTLLILSFKCVRSIWIAWNTFLRCWCRNVVVVIAFAVDLLIQMKTEADWGSVHRHWIEAIEMICNTLKTKMISFFFHYSQNIFIWFDLRVKYKFSSLNSIDLFCFVSFFSFFSYKYRNYRNISREAYFFRFFHGQYERHFGQWDNSVINFVNDNFQFFFSFVCFFAKKTENLTWMKSTMNLMGRAISVGKDWMLCLFFYLLNGKDKWKNTKIAYKIFFKISQSRLKCRLNRPRTFDEIFWMIC